jgi:hypothetical protein
MMRWFIISFIVLIGFFTLLCINKKGEVLEQLVGDVQRCEMLGGSQQDDVAHATIKIPNGSYVISGLKNCEEGTTTSIYLRRGALYFNSQYTTQ